jgi:hypothetical protein
MGMAETSAGEGHWGMRKAREYDNSYPTCFETFSTLRIFSDDLVPGEITARLAIEPTDTFHKGDAHSLGKLRRKTNGWFYTTEHLTDSRDFRRHLDIILDALDGRNGAVLGLQSKGCTVDIVTYWVSTGQGGPWLMPDQMLKLGSLGIEIWWDVYFRRDGEGAANEVNEPKEASSCKDHGE